MFSRCFIERTIQPSRYTLTLFGSLEELRSIQTTRLEKLALSITEDVEKAFDSGVGAIALYAMTWGLSEQPSAYVWCRIVEPLVPRSKYDVELASTFRAVLRALRK